MGQLKVILRKEGSPKQPARCSGPPRALTAARGRLEVGEARVENLGESLMEDTQLLKPHILVTKILRAMM